MTKDYGKVFWKLEWKIKYKILYTVHNRYKYGHYFINSYFKNN